MAKKDKVQEQVATPTVEQQEQQPAPSLTLQDLVLVAQIIQITSQRGAFKADELADVGGLYNKLVIFLQSTGALTPAPAASTEETK
jgi:hypothetical protein